MGAALSSEADLFPSLMAIWEIKKELRDVYFHLHSDVSNLHLSEITQTARPFLKKQEFELKKKKKAVERDLAFLNPIRNITYVDL